MLNTSIGYHSDVEYYNLGKVDFLIEIITLPVILPSNMFVAYLIIRGIKTGKSKSVPNMLVLALSISDLMTGVLGYPLRIISYLFRSWVGGSSACLYEQFVLKTFISFSEFVVVLLGVERYLSIGKPFFYDKHCSMKLFYIILAIFLGIALLLGTFSMLTYTNEDLEMHVESHNLYCFPPVTSNSFIKIAYESWLLAQGLVLITAMLFCNISVDRALASLKKRVAMTCPRNRQEHLKQQDMLFGMSREFSRLMTAINITFVVCMAPSLIRSVCHLAHIWTSTVADFVAWHLLLCTNWINPLLYGILRRQLRKRIKIVTVKLCPCCRSNRIFNLNDIDDDQGFTDNG